MLDSRCTNYMNGEKIFSSFDECGSQYKNIVFDDNDKGEVIGLR